MSTRGYTILGWIVWQLASRVAKYEMTKTRTKAGAVGVIALVLVGGILAARGDSDD